MKLKIIMLLISPLLIPVFGCDNGMDGLLINPEAENFTVSYPYSAFYSFDDTSDGSGNGHTLVNNGAAASQNRDGADNKAFDFSGGCLTASDVSELNFTTEMTLTAWVKSTNVNADQKILGKVNGPTNLGYLVALQNGRIYVEMWDVDGVRFSYNDGAIPLSNNVWYHIAFTWRSGGNMTTYVNGALDKQQPASAKSIGQVSDKCFTVGAAPWVNTTLPFLGSIDDIRIYPNELSQAEVNYLYTLPAD